jgi:hypothetical protein
VPSLVNAQENAEPVATATATGGGGVLVVVVVVRMV